MMSREYGQYKVFVFDDNPDLLNGIKEACFREDPYLWVFSTTNITKARLVINNASKQDFFGLEVKVIVVSDNKEGISLLREVREKYPSFHTVLLGEKATTGQIQGFFDEYLVCHFSAKDIYFKEPKKFLRDLANTIVRLSRNEYSGNVPIADGRHRFKALLHLWIGSLPDGVKTKMLDFAGRIRQAEEILTDPDFFDAAFKMSSY